MLRATSPMRLPFKDPDPASLVMAAACTLSQLHTARLWMIHDH